MARVLTLDTRRYDCRAQLCTRHTVALTHRQNPPFSRHVFNTKAVSPKLPQNTVSVSHPRVHNGIVKTRDVPLARFGTGVQHTGRGCGWGVVSTAQGGSQRRGVRFSSFFLGVQAKALALKERGQTHEWAKRAREINTAPGTQVLVMFYYPIRQVEIVPLIHRSLFVFNPSHT